MLQYSKVSGFACAILADKPVDLADAKLKVDAPQRVDARKRLLEAPYGDGDGGR